jgi:hypothetical protein
MSGTQKRVRFIRPYLNYRVGDEIVPNGALRDELKRRGYIEIIDDPSPVRARGTNRMAAPAHRRRA